MHPAHAHTQPPLRIHCLKDNNEKIMRTANVRLAHLATVCVCLYVCVCMCVPCESVCVRARECVCAIIGSTPMKNISRHSSWDIRWRQKKTSCRALLVASQTFRAAAKRKEN
jgi:hypothetical protein